jgi:enterochelin esterase family protein
MISRTLKNIFVITNLFTVSVLAQSNFQNFLNRVNSITDSTAKAAVIDSFMNYARTEGIPYIEDNTANFIYRGTASIVNVAGDFNGWNPSSTSMTNLYETNFFYYSKNFEMNARLDYKFVTNGGTWILDPENLNKVAGGFGPNSELAMPEFIQPWEIKYKSGINHGSVVYRTIYSNSVSSNYQLQIYLPYGYDTLKSYPTVYFHDGAEYVSLGSAVNVIDNLIDSGKIEDVIAVFVTPNNRNEEYAGSKRNEYRLFFVNELVPYIDNNYKTIQNTQKRLVLGDSFGGNISALISYNHPDVFGNCGLHSGAFWPNNYEAYNLIVNGPVENIRFSSVWGTYESLFTNMRDFIESLQSKGYQQKWLELPEGHSWGLWRANIDFLLIYFFPKQVTSVVQNENILPQKIKLFQNYPNPFNSSTKISWQSPFAGRQVIKVFDILGNEIVVLLDEERSAGYYEVEFSSSSALPSGVYMYRLQIDSFVEIKKMILLN